VAVEQSDRPFAPYAWSTLLTAVAAVVRVGLTPLLGSHYPLGTFYAAVAVIGWFWGVGPAVLAAVLGYLAGAYLFLAPEAASLTGSILELSVYAAICSSLIAMVYRVFERQHRLDMALSAHEVTRQEEKRAAEALALSERRYRSVSEAFDFGMWSADAAGHPTFLSPRLLDFLGVPLEQAEASVRAAIQAPPRDIEEAFLRRDRCMVSGEPWDWEYSLRGQDGSVRRIWCRGVPLRTASGALSSWAGLNLDVTERYEAARARDHARQQLEAVTHAMSVGVAQCNRQFEYVWANPAYARVIGRIPEQSTGMAGRRVEEFVGREMFERLEPYYVRALGGECAEYEGPGIAGVDGNTWVHATFTPLWNSDDLPVGCVMVVNDLTERRNLEHELRDTNRRKDEFLATLAHELRNPLAPMRYATQLLKPGTPPEMAADASRMIDRQLAHMARLLDDLLDVSRITRGALEIRREILDLRATVMQSVEAARPLAQAGEHALQMELPDYPLPVRGDETRLLQVIGNLISNAIKFTPPGGWIRLSAAIEDAMVVVRVRDSGRGMSAELLRHVFEMFIHGEPNSREQTGLGVGLALAKQMIELHGGRIEAQSDGPGRGSEFQVFVPRAAELPAMQELAANVPPVSVLGADGIRVLVVDDNVDAADILSEFLKLAGYQTRVAYDGRSAVEMAETLEPAVVLLDLGLPYLDGFEVARRLRSLPWGGSACLIALTGWGQEEDLQRSREAGFDEHLTKPVDPERLLARIIMLTRGRRPRGNGPVGEVASPNA
jgi:PAS domain S-box-containing protein